MPGCYLILGNVVIYEALKLLRARREELRSVIESVGAIPARGHPPTETARLLKYANLSNVLQLPSEGDPGNACTDDSEGFHCRPAYSLI